MERIKELHDIEVPLRDNQCEQSGCSGTAIYTCPENNYMLLCHNCKNARYFETQAISYINPKDLSLIMMEVLNRLERMIRISDGFEKGEKVDLIFQEVKRYQQDAIALKIEVKHAILFKPIAYRKISYTLYDKVLAFKAELLESDVYYSFGEHLVRYHLTQLHDVSDYKTLLDQIQQFVGREEISSQLNVSMSEIAEQVNSLQHDTDSLNSQIIRIAQLIHTLLSNQRMVALQSNNIFSTDPAVLQALVRLTLPSGAENSNLSTTIK